MKFVVIIHLPRVGGMACVGPYDTEEAAQTWIDGHIGSGASASIGVLWEPDSNVKFG